MAKVTSEEKLVVVLTDMKEIFCGWTMDPKADRIDLRSARQAVYYSADTHGLLGLATDGPAKGSRIGPTATKMEIRHPANVIECSAKAAEAWEAAEWE